MRRRSAWHFWRWPADAKLGPFDPACTVFDIVPKPDVTPLMACATKAGCRVGGGRLMIEWQTDAVLDFLGFGL